MSNFTPNAAHFQASLSSRIRLLIARGALLLMIGVPAYFGATTLASAHATVAPSHVITPLDPTPPVRCAGAQGPC